MLIDEMLNCCFDDGQVVSIFEIRKSVKKL